MASVIILVYGDYRLLVPKPANYAALIDVARDNFSELSQVSDDNITFHFTPEWFDREVKLDRNAFAEVHTRAVLRVATTTSAPAQNPENDGCKVQDGDVAVLRFGHEFNLCFIHVPTSRKLTLSVEPRSKLRLLEEDAADFLGVVVLGQRFYYKDESLVDYDTPESMGMEDGDVIEMYNDF